MSTKKSTSAKTTKVNTTANSSVADRMNMSLAQLWTLSTEEIQAEQVSANLTSAKFKMQGCILDINRQIAEANIELNRVKANASTYQAAIIANRMNNFDPQVQLDGYSSLKKHANAVAQAEAVVAGLQEGLDYMVNLESVLFS
jgi:hypothetical protein